MGGDDKLSIFSFNSSRRGLCSMPGQRRSKYLEDILNGAKPDICFLPGDDKTLKYSGVIQGYEQYLTPNGDGAALLYSASKVEMKEPGVNLCSFGPLAGLDYDQLVCRQVDIRAPKPANNVIKQFNLISWQYTLYEETKINVYTLTESLIRFAQRLAWQTGKGVLIGGEMTIDFNSLTAIVKKLCKEEEKQFLTTLQPEMDQLGYLPSMTKATFTDQRHLFMMKVFQCSSSSTGNGIVNTWNGQVADCFIASKTLQLTEASLVNVEQVIGRQIKLCPLREHAPTKTEMVIPPRPPRHHGG